MFCPNCNSSKVIKKGFTEKRSQRFQCKDCLKLFLGDYLTKNERSSINKTNGSGTIRHDKDKVTRIVKMGKQGLETSVICEATGMSPSTVNKWLRIHGIEKPEPINFRKLRRDPASKGRNRRWGSLR